MTATHTRRDVSVETVGSLLLSMPTGFDRVEPPTPVLYEVVGHLDATLLVSLIFDVRRHRPLLVVTVGSGHKLAVDPQLLAAQSHGVADVVVLRNVETVQAVCAGLPTWMATYAGACRVFMPGADLSDDGERHTLIAPNWRDLSSYPARIARAVRAAAARKREGDPVVALERELRDHEKTKREVVKLRAEVAEARGHVEQRDATEAIVFSDPEVQFEHELYLYWLRTTPEYDRDTWPLRAYRLGPEFLKSMEQVKELGRPRMIRACVDVVTGRYAEINGREAKRLNDGTATSGKGKPALVREADNAQAWRCNVQMTGIGGRLMWWETTDGEPELARINSHNDFRIV